MTTPNEDDNRHVRPFAAWLQEQARGRTHAELGDALHDLVARVRDTGKKGALNLTITIAPLDPHTGALKVTDEIKLKLPEHDRPASIAYVDRAGNLSRRDPNQPELPIVRSLDDPPHDPITGEIKEAR